MLNLSELGNVDVWPDHLMPVGEGDHHKEAFPDWWERHSEELSHINEEIAEQWIYRHWQLSVAKFIDIKKIEWKVEIWPAKKFITDVGTVRGNEEMDPVHDYKVFKGDRPDDPHPTAKALDTGEWDYAPIVLDTPSGFIDCKEEHINKPYFLVEGHSRQRYLNALMHRGEILKDQRVFVIQSNRITS